MESSRNVLPSIFLSNVRSLLPKFDEVCVFASMEKPDVMIFCETWLNAEIDKLVCIPGYNDPIRHDRVSRRGGGVCIYSREEISCWQINDIPDPPPFVECVWTVLPACKLIILAMYVPPNLLVSQENELIDYIISQADKALNVIESSSLIIAGDLNQLPTSALESTLSLNQCVNTPTRGSSILDKILIDDILCENFKEAVVGPNFGNADHLSILLKPHSEQITSSRIVKVFDYRDSHVAAFVDSLRAQPWHRLYRSEETVDFKCNLFYNFIRQAQNCIPYSFVKITSKDKPWITPTLKHLINCRYNAFRRGDFEKYRHYKSKVRDEIIKAKDAWLERLKASPHGIWKAMPSANSKAKGNIQHLLKDYSPNDLASALNSEFSSVFSRPSTVDFKEDWLSLDNEDWKIEINTQTITNLLRNLKLRKSAGNDNLTPRLLKASSDVLAGPLAHLFATSILSCQVPKRWKDSLVVPIPKSKHPSLSDFRPVSLLNIPSKILEKLVLESVKPKLISSYGSNQYGFRPGSSTLNAHIAIHDYVTRLLDQSTSNGVIMIAMDLSKAFDKLSHNSLLESMINEGLPKKFILWVSDFLKGRQQRVTIQGAMSKNIIPVTSGVPQGSILAPYFFAFTLGTLMPTNQETVYIKFADDITILLPFKKSTTPSEKIQEEIQHVKDWCHTHGLAVNQRKTRSIIFVNSPLSEIQLSSHNLPNLCSHLTILGVIFEESLKWNLHTDLASKKASQRIHVLKILKKIPTATKKDLIQMYRSYIQSIMEYNSPLMVGMSSKNNSKLERINRRCHRIICGMDCDCEVFTPMNERRLKKAEDFFTKIMNPANISHDLLPHRLPRTQKFFFEYMRTTLRLKSFIPHSLLRSNSRS